MKRILSILTLTAAAATLYAASPVISRTNQFPSSCGTAGYILEANGDCTSTWVEGGGSGGSSILNQGTLQAGAQFYVSSGSVSTSLYAGIASGYLGIGNGDFGTILADPIFEAWASPTIPLMLANRTGSFFFGDALGNFNGTYQYVDQTLGKISFVSKTENPLTIDGGNVGINATSPSTALDIYDSAGVALAFFNPGGTIQLGDVGCVGNCAQIEINQQDNNVTVASTAGLRLSSGSGGVSVIAPNMSGNDIYFTLPNSSGTAGDFLSTDGAGNLSWTASSSSGSWASYSPTLTGFGTTSSVQFYYYQSGKILYINGSFVSGTPTSVEARISVPVTCGTNMPSVAVVGTVLLSNPGTSPSGPRMPIPLCAPSGTYITWGAFQPGNSTAFTNITADALVGSGFIVKVNLMIPVD